MKGGLMAAKKAARTSKTFSIVKRKPGETWYVQAEPVPQALLDAGFKEGEGYHFYVHGGPGSGVEVASANSFSDYTKASKALRKELGNSGGVIGTLGDDGQTIVLDKPVVVGSKGKIPPMPPTAFDDTPERRAGIDAEVEAIRTLCYSMLQFEDVNAAVEGLNGLQSFTVDPMVDTIESVSAKLELAHSFTDVVAGLSDEAKKRVFRQVAHAFNIPKGLTSLR